MMNEIKVKERSRESKENINAYIPLSQFGKSSPESPSEGFEFLDLDSTAMFPQKKTTFSSVFQTFSPELSDFEMSRYLEEDEFKDTSDSYYTKEDYGVDGLGKHLVALDLNVDNHLSKQPTSNRLHFSVSGHASMTPNPRTEFKSPQSQKLMQNNFESFALKSPKLREKIRFEDDIPELDFLKPHQAEFYPQLQHYNSSSSMIGNPMYSNFHPMQQVYMANGLPGVVVPAATFEGRNGATLRRATSFETARKNMVSPPHQKANFKGSNSIPLEMPLSSFKGQLFQMSQEQNGCRYLQQKVELEKETACSLILHEVRPRLVQLMMDPFGNYLFQKLIENVGTYQRLEMLQRVKNHLVQASLNLHGTRSVQKFIELCADFPDQLDIIVEVLHPHITKLSMDTNGNHVVQRCLQKMSQESVQFVYETALRDVLVITKHRHGCCVFQRCIDFATPERRAELVNKVITNAVVLMEDPFGNYVVQYVLDNCAKSEIDALISQTLGMLAKLSMQKFSSNVVETCLSTAPVELKAAMINEIAGSENLKDLLHDQYANYVVQRALLVADDDQGMRLVKNIKPHLAELSKFNPTCARRVVGKVLKRFPSFSEDPKFMEYAQTPQGGFDLGSKSHLRV